MKDQKAIDPSKDARRVRFHIINECHVIVEEPFIMVMFFGYPQYMDLSNET